MLRKTFGADFSSAEIDQALQSRVIHLGPASEDNSAEYDWESKGRTELLASIEHRLVGSEYRQAVRQFIRANSIYAELQDRVALCVEIADNHSPDQRVNNQEFCLLLLAKKDNETYRQQVVTHRENKMFAAMSPLEIKSYLAKQRAAQATQSFEEQVAKEIVSPAEQTLLEAVDKDLRPPLPERTSHGEEIDAAYLNRLQATDYSAYRELLQRHGRIRLEARIRGIK